MEKGECICEVLGNISPFFISFSVSVRMSWRFYEQDVLFQLKELLLFCPASGSKLLNWTTWASYILREH